MSIQHRCRGKVVLKGVVMSLFLMLVADMAKSLNPSEPKVLASQQEVALKKDSKYPPSTRFGSGEVLYSSEVSVSATEKKNIEGSAC